MTAPDIHIPDEAALYARDALKKAKECRSCAMYDDKAIMKSCACFREARAACLAMLRAWPGIKLTPYWEHMTHKRRVEMILPLTENADG